MRAADIIFLKKDEILNKWMKTLIDSMPEVKNHDKTAIQNSVPDLLDAIVEVLISDNDGNIIVHSQKHALDRTSFDVFSLKHIIQEYNFLKKEIFRETDKYSEVDPGERDKIMFAFDQAIEEAAETFYRVRQGVQVNARKIAERKADKLELRDENREEFIHSISHDLNNPLNAIMGSINLLEHDQEAEKVNKILNVLKTSSSQAESLIKEILDVSGISEKEKLPVNKELVNLLNDLEGEIEVFKVLHRNHIDLHSNRDEINVEVDLNLIRRAFDNLMSNAVKHGGYSVPITVNCNLEGDKLELSVHNGGQTIPNEVLDKIFDRYYKINKSGKGWGIGLSFVKEVAAAHHGDVTVRSNEKEGTTFELIIPVK